MTGILGKLDARLLVLISRALMSLGTPIVAFLTLQASALSGGIIHPISFCNVLLVGNLCAAGVVLGIFGARRIVEDLRRLSWRGVALVLLTGAFNALLSALIFIALETTSVTNTVLLARLGPLLYAVLALIALGQPIRGPEWVGFGVIAVGIVVTVFTGAGFTLNHGDWLILSSCGVYAISVYVTRNALQATSLRALVFSRNVVSALVFFWVAIYYFGPHHFADAFAGQLWVIMSVYALVVVVGSQITWYEGITRLTPVQVAKWTVLTPGFGIVFALIINGERPNLVQLIALALVTVGLVIANLGKGEVARAPKTSTGAPESSLTAN